MTGGRDAAMRVGPVAAGGRAVTATMAAASLLLAGGAGLLTSLLVAPVPGLPRRLALAALSCVALVLGLVLMGGLAEAAAGLP
ncbi:hypothetical protein [Falsiroseomonas sp. CW058]|uniref:hypothetical protein n=1 Tax=Falsiroseomonas sp. CW058 TaxID=3388664 RepID=UPI003D323419